VGHTLHLIRRRGRSDNEAFGKNLSAQTSGVETHRFGVEGRICSRGAADNRSCSDEERKEETETWKWSERHHNGALCTKESERDNGSDDMSEIHL